MLKSTSKHLVQLYYRAQVSSKSYQRTCWYKIANMRTSLVRRNMFDYAVVLECAQKWANSVDKLNCYTASSAQSAAEPPDADWWKKLCDAAIAKHPQLSNYGSKLLHEKLVRSIGNRIVFEKLYSDNRDEIERFDVREPIFVVGLPRTNASMAFHLNARSGHFMSMRLRDTMFPGIPSFAERQLLSDQIFKRAPNVHPQLQSVFHMRPDMPDTDVGLQQLCPRSLSWGMLHGLPQYLYETMQEDQEHVFDFVHRALKVFQWYRQCNEFPNCVVREVNEIAHPEAITREGRKLQLDRMPWMIHSPFALLHAKQLHKVFPDMRLIWCHRAVSQCVASMCASIATHNSVFTGKSLTTAQMGEIGEQVCGVFGSGSGMAVDYFASFPFDRMVHWHNKDIQRSGSRLVTKTLDSFNIETDRFRKHQIIDGTTEWNQLFRPKLDAELAHFGLHEGIVAEHFAIYIHQFEEYAYEPKFGIQVEDYKLMSADYDKQRFMLDNLNSKQSQTSFGMLQPPGGKHLFADNTNREMQGRHKPMGPHDM